MGFFLQLIWSSREAKLIVTSLVVIIGIAIWKTIHVNSDSEENKKRKKFDWWNLLWLVIISAAFLILFLMTYKIYKDVNKGIEGKNIITNDDTNNKYSEVIAAIIGVINGEEPEFIS